MHRILEIAYSIAGARAIRFIFVGVAVAGLFFSLCYIFEGTFGWSPFIAAFVAYLICFAVGYVGQKTFAFGSQLQHIKSLPRYAVLQVAVALVTATSTQVAGTWLDLDVPYSSLFATALAGAFSFFGSYFWVFRTPPLTGSSA